MCAVVCADLVAPSAAVADRIEIELDFSGSTLTAFGAVTIPPGGSITTPTPVKLRVPATGTMTATASAVPGLASLIGFSPLVALVNKQTFGATFTGHQSLHQLSTGLFSLTTTLSRLTPLLPIAFYNDTFIQCLGPSCNVLFPSETFPLSTMASTTTFRALTLNGVNNPPASVVGTLSSGGVVYNLVGTEVSRSILMPEPGKTTQLAVAILALGGLLGLRRLRSPRDRPLGFAGARPCSHQREKTTRTGPGFYPAR